MKREGWQHGIVRSPIILPPPPFNPRHDGEMAFYTKVPLKPTNHSKFTGKCRRARCQECHSHPISKSRGKAKGAYKLKACDVVLNHRLASWRVVVDKENVLKLKGASASEILSHLSGSWCYHGDEEDDDRNGEDDVEFGNGDSCAEAVGLMIKGEEREGDGDEEEEEEEEEVGPSSLGDEKDDDMGFYVVGLAWEYLDEEDWLVVGDI